MGEDGTLQSTVLLNTTSNKVKAVLQVSQSRLLTFATIRMKGVFRSKVHKESCPSLGKPERIVFRRDNVRIHRRLYSFLERRLESHFLLSAAENIENVLLIIDDPEPVGCASGIEELMGCLYACSKGKRTFENRLGGFVFAIPRLVFVTKEEPDTLDVHLPRGV